MALVRDTGPLLALLDADDHLSADDAIRVAELEVEYSDLDLGMVDASVIAVCDRLREENVATLDHRHFGIVRPRHCDRLRLLPAS